jgi:DNA-3-methyladenine glycosylase
MVTAVRHRVSSDFYEQDTRFVAQQLLGMTLVHQTEAGIISGMIVETEAYLYDDPASHSFAGTSKRSEVMFGSPGHAYVYLSYGIHEMLNIVTREEGVGEAVLIRAAAPIEGIELMRRNRNQPSAPAHLLASGPGRLAQAFAISRANYNGLDLRKLLSPLWIEPGELMEPSQIVQTTRIGITKAADQPLRYLIKGNASVSRHQKSRPGEERLH